MAQVTVTPDTFTLVAYDADRLRALAERLVDEIGLGDVEVRVEIDETTPLSRQKLTSLDPVVLAIEGGAIEDSTRPRHLSERAAADVIGRLLLRARDRRDPGFADAPEEQSLTLPQATAWDAWCMGRLERLGYDARKPRRLYHFRNRHGFSDVADAVFERLWNAESLSWADLESACAETAAVAQGAGAGATAS